MRSDALLGDVKIIKDTVNILKNRAFQAGSKMITEATYKKNNNRESLLLKYIYLRLVLLAVYICRYSSSAAYDNK